MTPAELQSLQPGPEADAACAVARGWKTYPDIFEVDRNVSWGIFSGQPFRVGRDSTWVRWSPSEDANAALELLNEAWGHGCLVKPDPCEHGKWEAVVPSGVSVYTGDFKMACVACFLLAKGAVQP